MTKVTTTLYQTKGYQIIQHWLAAKEFSPFAFQEETWQHILQNKSGLVNAPTGCGKTFSVFLGAVIQFINEHPNDYQTKKKMACNCFGSRLCVRLRKTLAEPWKA